LDIADIFAMSQDKLNGLLYHDAAKNRPDLAAMSEDELTMLVRNRETLALITWEPYMHNPKLKHRLHRVRAPAMFVRGASDGLVSRAIPCRLRGAAADRARRDHPEGGTCAAGRAAGAARKEDPRFSHRVNRSEYEHESVALQRERLSLSPAGGRIRVDPRQPA